MDSLRLDKLMDGRIDALEEIKYNREILDDKQRSSLK